MNTSKITEERIDPDAVPKRKLYTGAEMPCIGLGTFGSDHITNETIAATVKDAISWGYRHIDCASVYGNEKEIGQTLSEVLNEGQAAREDLWITSKVWNDMHDPDDVIASCKQSLKDLQLDYLDLYLVHWPFPNYHAKGCDVDSRSQDAKPYIHKNYMKTWRAMEQLVDMGLVRHIGTSNMSIPKLELLLRDATIKPACNEMELHPHFQQPVLFDFVVRNNIVPIGFCPIGSPNRPERDRTPDDTNPLEDPVVCKIAQRLGIHPASVCLKWAVRRGQVPIPFSTNPKNYRSNLSSAVSEPLTEDDMDALAAIDKNSRFIKGHVFLWKDDQTWEALWDLDGRIAE